MKFITEYNNFRNISISTIQSQDIDEVVDLLYTAFSHLNTKSEIKEKLFRRIDNNLSIKLTKNGQILGVYLLAQNSLPKFIDNIKKDLFSEHKGYRITLDVSELTDNGLQGIALVVHPRYRGEGFGNMLKDYSENMGYDYVWGIQHKSLKNINDWLKRRKIVFESDNTYCTVKILR